MNINYNGMSNEEVNAYLQKKFTGMAYDIREFLGDLPAHEACLLLMWVASSYVNMDTKRSTVAAFAHLCDKAALFRKEIDDAKD
jgi:hypothetical protein